jgi:hypothetical protein
MSHHPRRSFVFWFLAAASPRVEDLSGVVKIFAPVV